MRPGTLWEAAGGHEAILRLASAHHRRCLDDPVLNHPFSHPGHPQHVERLAAYWSEIWGGPHTFSRTCGGHSAMLEMHARMRAQDDLGEIFTRCFTAALDDALPDDPELRRALISYMEWASAEVMGYSPADAQVPPGLPMPRWSWDGLQSDRVIAAGQGVRLRRLEDTPGDWQLLAEWLNQPHVRPWWDPDKPARTPADVHDEYLADLPDDSLSVPCVIEEAGAPAGFIQFYRWASYPEETATVGFAVGPQDWGIDILIGEPERLGRGLASRAVDLLAAHLAAAGGEAILLTTATDNDRAQRVYRRCGFRTIAEVLDTDTRNGERVPCLLMRRDLTRPPEPRRPLLSG